MPLMKAIVTGHTRGLGAAIAETLLARGIAVLGVARGENEALAKRYPAAFEQAPVNLGDAAELTKWLASDTLPRYLTGAASVLLVNNAGTVQPVGPLTMQSAADIANAVSLNVAAPMMLASAVASVSRASDIRIVHVSSGAGRSAYAGWSVYCATKAALDRHAQSVALDGAPKVRICSLAPGVIDTAMQAEIRASSLQQFPMRERFDDLKRSGQLADPKECADRLVEYLLSPQFGNEAVADLRTYGR